MMVVLYYSLKVILIIHHNISNFLAQIAFDEKFGLK